MRLAFKWDIVDQDGGIPHLSDFRVVRLDNAERRGVPLPAGWAAKIAELTDVKAEEGTGALSCKQSVKLLPSWAALAPQCRPARYILECRRAW